MINKYSYVVSSFRHMKFYVLDFCWPYGMEMGI